MFAGWNKRWQNSADRLWQRRAQCALIIRVILFWEGVGGGERAMATNFQNSRFHKPGTVDPWKCSDATASVQQRVRSFAILLNWHRFNSAFTPRVYATRVWHRKSPNAINLSFGDRSIGIKVILNGVGHASSRSSAGNRGWRRRTQFRALVTRESQTW